MFDKLYKEANDEIPVNTLLLEKLKSEASKGKKPKSYSFMYKYGFAAAAILIVVVSLNIMPDMKKSQENEKRYPGSPERIIMTDTNTKPDETSESLTKEEITIKEESEKAISNDISQKNSGVASNDNTLITPPEKTQTKNNSSELSKITNSEEKQKVEPSIKQAPAKSAYDKTEETNQKKIETVEKKESIIKTEDSINNSSDNSLTVKKEESILKKADVKNAKDSVIAKNPANESSDKKTSAKDVSETEGIAKSANESLSTISENYENDISSFSAEPSARSSGGGSGGGSSGATSSPTPISEPEMLISLEKYCSIFGFNPNSWNIPKNMARTDGMDVYISQNPTTMEYEEKNHTIVYSGNDKTIYVTLLPDADNISSIINSRSGERYNGNLIINYTDSSYTSYIVKNGNGYIIETNNLEKKEIYSLIDSIG